MTKIYTLTLAPSLDSATQTPQIYRKANFAAARRYLNLAAAGSTWPAP